MIGPVHTAVKTDAPEDAEPAADSIAAPEPTPPVPVAPPGWTPSGYRGLLGAAGPDSSRPLGLLEQDQVTQPAAPLSGGLARAAGFAAQPPDYAAQAPLPAAMQFHADWATLAPKLGLPPVAPLSPTPQPGLPPVAVPPLPHSYAGQGSASSRPRAIREILRAEGEPSKSSDLQTSPAPRLKFDLNRRTPEDEKRFSDMLLNLASREGGFSNNPDDKGGPTNFGISLNFMRQYGIDKNDDGAINIDDVKLLAPEQAASLIKEKVYYARRIQLLPEELQPLFLDSAVNIGEYGWAQLLQKTLNDMGATDASGKPLVIDGTVGQRTLEAIDNAVRARRITELNNRYVAARVDYHLKRIEEDPSQEKFRNNWLRRTKGFMK